MRIKEMLKAVLAAAAITALTSCASFKQEAVDNVSEDKMSGGFCTNMAEAGNDIISLDDKDPGALDNLYRAGLGIAFLDGNDPWDTFTGILGATENLLCDAPMHLLNAAGRGIDNGLTAVTHTIDKKTRDKDIKFVGHATEHVGAFISNDTNIHDVVQGKATPYEYASYAGKIGYLFWVGNKIDSGDIDID